MHVSVDLLPSYMYVVLQSAVGWEYQAELSKHESQTDAAKGFGGRYGVQQERVDEVMAVRKFAGTLTDCV